MTKTWIAAVAAGVLLLGGGIGGYFIGAANDDWRDGPGWHHQYGPDREGFRGDTPPVPWNAPWNEDGGR